LRYFFGEVDHLGGDAFALKSFTDLIGEFSGTHSTQRAGRPRGLAEQKLADLVDLRAVLHDPVVAGDAAIQVAVLDVAADLLRANQPDLQLLVVHIREYRTGC
jgi:hypothetical protein